MPHHRFPDLEEFFTPFVLPNVLKDYVSLFSGLTVLHLCFPSNEVIAEYVEHAERKLSLSPSKTEIVAKDIKWVLYAACKALRGINLHAIGRGHYNPMTVCDL